MDKISKEARSQNMSHIRSKNTQPELILRKKLFQQGYRYRLHYKLPGSPDIVFPSNKVAVFVNGCFWHCHGCKYDHKPKTNKKYWDDKKEANMRRDKNNNMRLKKLGWKPIIVWECDVLENLQKTNSRIVKKLNS